MSGLWWGEAGAGDVDSPCGPAAGLSGASLNQVPGLLQCFSQDPSEQRTQRGLKLDPRVLTEVTREAALLLTSAHHCPPSPLSSWAEPWDHQQLHHHHHLWSLDDPDQIDITIILCCVYVVLSILHSSTVPSCFSSVAAIPTPGMNIIWNKAFNYSSKIYYISHIIAAFHLYIFS